MAEESQAQGQKRTLSESQDHLAGIKAVLLDVEGTTTPIKFVKEKLISYVKDNLKTYIEAHFEDEECQEDIDELRKQAGKDKEAEVEGNVEIPAKDGEKEAIIDAVVQNITAQIEKERTTGALEKIQGHVWREAYKTGAIQGEVFQDVVDALKKFKEADKKVCVFSAGNIETQKLLFGYSDKGDLTEQLSGYYDATTGSKTEKDSYVKIAESLEVKPEEIMFLTDIPTEAAPASEAGLKVSVVVREGNAELTDEDKKTYNTISSLSELFAEEKSEDEPPAKQ